MQRGHQMDAVNGANADGDFEFSSPAAFDSAYPFRNGVMSEITFQSLLSLQELPLSSLPPPPATLDFFSGDADTQKLVPGDEVSELKMKMMKMEGKEPELSIHPYCFGSEDVYGHMPEMEDPYDFMPNCSGYVPGRLPELESVDEFGLGESTESTRKRVRPSTTLPVLDPYVLEAIIGNFDVMSKMKDPPSNSDKAAQAATARRQRTERMRRNRYAAREKADKLQKLLPWDKKMDMATVYEQAYKYVEFLKAQVSVLQSMPPCSVFKGAHNSFTSADVYGGLELLNRQQLLQVLVNSPAAQSVMSSNGFCVYSVEQLQMLKEIAAKKILEGSLPSNKIAMPPYGLN